jgi:hypothetical protein
MILTKKNGWGVYQAKKKYEAESATVTDAVNGDRSKEVQDMQKNCWL